MDWGSVIGGIGIGSIAASILTQYFNARENRKQRRFNEKKSAYLGFLDALSSYDRERTAKNSKGCGLWCIKVSLVGSPNVIKFSKAIIEGTGEKSPLDNLIEAMRNDLNIDTRKLN